MNDEQLTALLAERVMRWRAFPNRIVKSGRTWMPRWRFQPITKIEDARQLLEKAAPRSFAMDAIKYGGFRVKVRISGTTGEARESSQARAITFAVARALGIEVGQP